MTSRAIAIIPARGGSKGIPNKNLVEIGGRSLIEWTVAAARDCDRIDDIYLSTNSTSIAQEASRFGVNVIDRPDELAADNTRTEPAIVHLLEEMLRSSVGLPESFVLLQPTSPFRTSADISSAFELFDGTGSVVSVVSPNHHPLKSFYLKEDGALAPMIDEETMGSPRQSLPDMVQANGAIYLVNTRAFLESKSLYTPPVRGLVMSPENSIDIDSATDLAFAQFLVESRSDLKNAI